MQAYLLFVTKKWMILVFWEDMLPALDKLDRGTAQDAARNTTIGRNFIQLSNFVPQIRYCYIYFKQKP